MDRLANVTRDHYAILSPLLQAVHKGVLDSVSVLLLFFFLWRLPALSLVVHVVSSFHSSRYLDASNRECFKDLLARFFHWGYAARESFNGEAHSFGFVSSGLALFTVVQPCLPEKVNNQCQAKHHSDLEDKVDLHGVGMVWIVVKSSWKSSFVMKAKGSKGSWLGSTTALSIYK